MASKRKPLTKIEGFHFDEVAHVYTLDGKPLHGVTSVLSIISKPALIGWASNTNTEYIKEHANKEYVDDKFTYYQVSEGVLEEARTAHTKKKEKAGELGSDVHSLIEALVKGVIGAGGGIVDPDTKSDNPQVQLFIDWARDNQVKFIESEKRVYSKESWYAGTLDLVLEMKGEKYIADIKTSSAIYPEAYLQMAAYQGAMEEMNEHTDIKGAMVINLPKKGGFEIGMNYAYDDNRVAFLAALVLYKQLNAIGGPQKEIKTKKVINI